MLHPKAGFFAPAKLTSPSPENCQNCPHRMSCPYFYTHVYHKMLEAAACRGEASARCLLSGAAKLRQALPQAGTIQALLNANKALCDTLSQVLCEEMKTIEALGENGKPSF